MTQKDDAPQTPIQAASTAISDTTFRLDQNGKAGYTRLHEVRHARS